MSENDVDRNGEPADRDNLNAAEGLLYWLTNVAVFWLLVLGLIALVAVR